MNKILREKVQRSSVSSVLPITLIVLATQHDDHADAGRHACPVPGRCRAADRRHGVLFAWHGCFYDADGRGYRRTAAEAQKILLVVIAITLHDRHSDYDRRTGSSGARRTGPVHPEQHADLDGRSRCRPVLRARYCCVQSSKYGLSLLLILFYIAVFIFSAFVPNEFVSVAFDSGGVTTGPITVPFIMALGVGLASIRGDSGAQDDSFGLVALCSIGPVLAVLLLGIFYSGGDAGYTQIAVPELEDTRQVAAEFVHALPDYIREVVSALLPVIAFCAIFQLIFKQLSQAIQLQKIGIGFLYTFVGLALFLTGVNVGFMPAGHYLGQQFALSGHKAGCLIPLGMLIGYFLVTAEPAVHVLNRQVETITNGGISQRAMMLSLSIGVACSVGTGDAARAHGHLYLLHT